MAELPRLIGGVLSGRPGEPKFIARLIVGRSLDCALEVDDILTTGHIQVAVGVELPQITPKYIAIAPTIRRAPNEQTYTVSFELPSTTLWEGTEVIKKLFGADLETQYWYQLANTDMLGVKIDSALLSVTFQFPPGHPLNKPELWRQFADRLLLSRDQYDEVGAHADRVQVVLTAEAWEKREEVLPQMAAQFPV